MPYTADGDAPAHIRWVSQLIGAHGAAELLCTGIRLTQALTAAVAVADSRPHREQSITAGNLIFFPCPALGVATQPRYDR